MISSARLRQHAIAAVVGDKTAVNRDPREASNETTLHDEPLGNVEQGDEQDGAKFLDDGKMIRVCDKLIEVFLVDKPNPTDWRRLLAFSKEWNNLRPHFFKRCQDRADSEEDPGMKQNLLRLGRKLKEVGCMFLKLNKIPTA